MSLLDVAFILNELDRCNVSDSIRTLISDLLLKIIDQEKKLIYLVSQSDCNECWHHTSEIDDEQIARIKEYLK